MGTEILYAAPTAAVTRKGRVEAPHILFLVALAVDLFTPYLIWKGYIPAELRWVSHAAVAAMLILAVARMIVFNHVPRAFWLIVSVGLVWSVVAVMRGQSILATGWGVWLLFQFTFVGLFFYLEPRLPNRLADFLLGAGLAFLYLQVIVQLIQYATGEKIGDSLAGLFGRNATDNAVLYVFVLYCLFLGRWIVTRRWLGLATTLVLGVVTSVLGEVKLFPFVIAALSMVALVIFAARTRSLGRLLKYIVIVVAVITAYMLLYNALVPASARRPIQEFVTNPEMLNAYLNQSNRILKNGSYEMNMGRNYALSVGWNSLQTDPVTLLFGYGIGARSESQTFQTAGIGFASGDVGTAVGTSLLVLMQEVGLLGLAVLGGLFAWILIRLALDIRHRPNSAAIELRYALLIFTLFWPLWLWYGTIWTMRVPMLIYWMILGYVMAEARQPVAKAQIISGDLGVKP